MPASPARSFALAKFCMSLFFAAGCGFLMLSWLGVGYIVVVSEAATGGAEFHYGRTRDSHLEYRVIYGQEGDVQGDYRISPKWGIAWERMPKFGRTPPVFMFAVAEWLPAPPLLACAYLCFRKWRKQLDMERKRALGRCITCGYDLRAHQPGQKCPECGTEIPRLGWRPPKRDP